jgi:hypothetical protein
MIERFHGSLQIAIDNEIFLAVDLAERDLSLAKPKQPRD